MLKGENYTNQLYESYASRLAINTMINGECGIIDNYGDKMEVTYNNNIVTISNGMAVVKGGLIRETTYTTLNATLTDGLYYSVVLEIDLSQTNTRQEFNQGSLKLLSNNGSYPTLQQDDLSLSINTGVYQMELARFTTSASAITNFTDRRNILSYNSLIQELRSAISRVISEDLSATDISYDQNTTVKQKLDTMQTQINNFSTTAGYIQKYQMSVASDNWANEEKKQELLFESAPAGYYPIFMGYGNILRDGAADLKSVSVYDMWYDNNRKGHIRIRFIAVGTNVTAAWKRVRVDVNIAWIKLDI